VIRRGWREALREPIAPERDVEKLLQDLMLDAHAQIRLLGDRLVKASQEKIIRPGTTGVVATFHKQPSDSHGYILSYAHVGDSRIYLQRPSERLRRLTIDDGYLSIKVRDGLVSESDALRIDQAVFTIISRIARSPTC
jgi:serine/threonine protein phosphatase PrpC